MAGEHETAALANRKSRMSRKTPLEVITILGMKDKALTPEEYQRFLYACAQVIKPKPPRKPSRKGKVLKLADFRDQR